MAEAGRPPIWEMKVELERADVFNHERLRIESGVRSLWVQAQAWRTMRMDVIMGFLWATEFEDDRVRARLAEELWQELSLKVVRSLRWVADTHVEFGVENVDLPFRRVTYRCIIRVGDGKNLEQLINALADWERSLMG